MSLLISIREFFFRIGYERKIKHAKQHVVKERENYAHRTLKMKEKTKTNKQTVGANENEYAQSKTLINDLYVIHFFRARFSLVTKCCIIKLVYK